MAPEVAEGPTLPAMGSGTRDTSHALAGTESDLTSRRAGTVRAMDVDRIRSAAELEALTPDQRAASIRAGFVIDPDEIPGGLIDRARRKADVRVAATEGREAHQ